MPSGRRGRRSAPRPGANSQFYSIREEIRPARGMLGSAATVRADTLLEGFRRPAPTQAA